MKTIAVSTGNQAAPLSERGVDLYQTPVEATKSLIALAGITPTIWEPACGPGAISNVVHDEGFHVVSSDLIDYGWNHYSGVDFLMENHAGARAMIGPSLEDVTIVTNPPYRDATKFIEHALTLCPNVMMMLKLTMLSGQKRRQIINDHLKEVYVFSRRLPMMHRAGYTGKKSTSAQDHAWFIFEHGYSDPAKIEAIDWKDYQ